MGRVRADGAVTLIGLMTTRNGGWCLGASVRALLAACDGVVVLDHAWTETDDTLDVLEGITGDLSILTEPDPTWHEGAFHERTRAAAQAMGATHYLLIDEDEVISASLAPLLRAACTTLGPRDAVTVPWLTLVDDLHHYRRGGWGTDSYPVLFGADVRWEPGRPLLRDGRLPTGVQHLHSLEVGGLLHLHELPASRAGVKRAYYRMLETLTPARSIAAIEQSYAAPTLPRPVLNLPPEAWPAGLEQYIDLTRPDWRASACQRLWQTHGAARFAGLDLRGAGLPDLRKVGP